MKFNPKDMINKVKQGTQGRIKKEAAPDNLLDNKDELTNARAVYNDLYLKMNVQISRQWKIIFILGVGIILSIIMLSMLGSESKIDPIIVKVDGNNQILDVEQAANINYHTLYPEMATYFIEQFVHNARSVTFDGTYQQYLLEKAYAFTQGPATKRLEAFIAKRKPYKMAQNKVISVMINSVVPNVGGSAHTTQITWTEIVRSTSNDTILVKHTYTGQFTFNETDKPPQNSNILRLNPLGFYITHISWTQNFMNSGTGG